MEASVTVTVGVELPALVGEPLIAPEVGSIVRPAGRPVADQTSGAAPPVAEREALYATPAMPLPMELVVIANRGTMVSCNCLLTIDGVGLVESCTVTVVVKGPVKAVVPEITPL